MRRQPTHGLATARKHTLDWLDGRINYERVALPGTPAVHLGLARMRRLLRELGDPHLRYPVAHVAGTKGKGSTVAMLAAALEESGHRVGRYLSPHVHSVEERIAVDGVPITTADLVAAFQRVIPAVEALDAAAARRKRPGPTWFEVVTAAALVHFARQRVDVAVLETGLGGRFDATNVCRPLVTAITSISLDHMKLLGPTITRITREKAGIIKPRCPVVSAAVQPAARRVIAATAARRRAPLVQLGRDFVVRPRAVGRGSSFDLVVTDGGDTRRYSTALTGRHQADNAAVAAMAARLLDARGVSVPAAAIERGLRRATLPARIETVSRRPLVIVDAAHNVASMRALVDTLRRTLDRHRPRALVFAASADKQVEKMLDTVAGLFEHVIVTRYLRNPRAASFERLHAACVAAGLPAPERADTPAAALALARSRVGRRGLVVVAGSFFLAAEVGLSAGAAGRP